MSEKQKDTVRQVIHSIELSVETMRFIGTALRTLLSCSSAGSDLWMRADDLEREKERLVKMLAEGAPH